MTVGDYCDQCAEELGLPPGDFVGLTTHEVPTIELETWLDKAERLVLRHPDLSREYAHTIEILRDELSRRPLPLV